MNSKVATTKAAGSAGDIVKYALAILLVAAGVFAFYWYHRVAELPLARGDRRAGRGVAWSS